MMLIIHFFFTLQKQNEITPFPTLLIHCNLKPNSDQDKAHPHSISPQPSK